MNIEVIAEHSVCTEMLPDGAHIIDAGCRGFQFTNHMRSLGHKVVALDIDDFVNCEYHRIALTGSPGRVGVFRPGDPNATSTCPGDEVRACTLEDMCRMYNVYMWDLIKLDIEGDERDVIMNMGRAYATQLSIEFHLHTGEYQERQVSEMSEKLSELGYAAIQHHKYPAHGLQPNYWDSLFILKSAL